GRAHRPGANFSAVSQGHGTSRNAGYIRVRRHHEMGAVDLVEHSRRRHTNAVLGGEIVAAIVELRNGHPIWGPIKIAPILRKRFGAEAPSRSTVARVLKRLGRIKRRQRAPRTWTVDGKPHVEVHAPNDLWTIDFKGWWRATCG